MLRSRVLLVVLFAAGSLACGRVHLLENGEYRLEVVEEREDGCGILKRPGALWTANFVSAGHLVRMDYLLFPGEADAVQVTLSGAYQQNVEQFYVDGTEFDVTARANTTECLLDRLALHLEATETASPTEFLGELSIRYEADAPDACVCETIVRVRGVHQ